MARTVGLSLTTIQRIWDANRLAPQRMRTFKRSDDPAFAQKVEDTRRGPAALLITPRQGGLHAIALGLGITVSTP